MQEKHRACKICAPEGVFIILNVVDFIKEKKLADRVRVAVEAQRLEEDILEKVFSLPIRKSHAVRRFGSYVARAGDPIEIRLQFSLEEDLLVETFLHELAHCLDHLSNQSGKQYRRAHGRGWRNWAEALGINPIRCGESGVLKELHEKRLKVVAVCSRCGFELRRLRRLPRRKKYIHPECGGRLRPV